jgi:hypothetical protein
MPERRWVGAAGTKPFRQQARSCQSLASHWVEFCMHLCRIGEDLPSGVEFNEPLPFLDITVF